MDELEELKLQNKQLKEQVLFWKNKYDVIYIAILHKVLRINKPKPENKEQLSLFLELENEDK